MKKKILSKLKVPFIAKPINWSPSSAIGPLSILHNSQWSYWNKSQIATSGSELSQGLPIPLRILSKILFFFFLKQNSYDGLQGLPQQALCSLFDLIC